MTDRKLKKQKTKQARDEHALNIKKKHLLNNHHILINRDINLSYNQDNVSVYISKNSDYPSHLMELKSPKAIEKCIEKLKSKKVKIFDLDNKQYYATFEDFQREQMILRLAGVE